MKHTNKKVKVKDINAILDQIDIDKESFNISPLGDEEDCLDYQELFEVHHELYEIGRYYINKSFKILALSNR